jgi:hypothetical protein
MMDSFVPVAPNTCKTRNVQRVGLNSSPALNEPNNQNNNRNYEQNVNVATERIAANNAKQPQNEQDDKNRPEHSFTVLPKYAPASAAACITAFAAAHMVWCELRGRGCPQEFCKIWLAG